jgi:hypothetical protein
MQEVSRRKAPVEPCQTGSYVKPAFDCWRSGGQRRENKQNYRSADEALETLEGEATESKWGMTISDITILLSSSKTNRLIFDLAVFPPLLLRCSTVETAHFPLHRFCSFQIRRAIGSAEPYRHVQHCSWNTRGMPGGDHERVKRIRLRWLSLYCPHGFN